jgi:hypothetical protein
VVAGARVEEVVEADLPGLAVRVARIRRHPWPDPVLGRIAEVADPVVNRREPVTAEVASAVRLPALLMARAARELGARDSPTTWSLWPPACACWSVAGGYPISASG